MTDLHPDEMQSNIGQRMTNCRPHVNYDSNTMHLKLNTTGRPRSANTTTTTIQPSVGACNNAVLKNHPDKSCTKICDTASSSTQQKNNGTAPITAPNRQFIMLPSPTSNLTQARRVLQQLLRVKWPTSAHQSHVARLTKFTQLWYRIQKWHGEHMPSAQIQCDIILKSIRPWELKHAVAHIAKCVKGWQQSALTDTLALEATIRRECERLDDEAIGYRLTREPKLLPIVQLVVDGDITQATENYIIHQTNCTSTRAMGLARYIFHKHPHADTYTRRRQPSHPGTINVCGPGPRAQYIVNMNAQYFPGPPRSGNIDSRDHRVHYFAECLRAMARYIHKHHEHNCGVAIPWRIACGLAMGEWRVYASLIMHWAKSTRCRDGQPIHVTVYQLPPQNKV